MFTGAIIGAGLWVTLVTVGLFNAPKGAKLDVPETLLRGGIFTGVFAFWGWAVESVL